MRPIKLELTGFTCFKELQSISFDNLELFAIVGQTGAGKSSILDAITYALFGETSRLGSRGLEQLVSQGANGMQVALEFDGTQDELLSLSLSRPDRNRYRSTADFKACLSSGVNNSQARLVSAPCMA